VGPVGPGSVPDEPPGKTKSNIAALGVPLFTTLGGEPDVTVPIAIVAAGPWPPTTDAMTWLPDTATDGWQDPVTLAFMWLTPVSYRLRTWKNPDSALRVTLPNVHVNSQS